MDKNLALKKLLIEEEEELYMIIIIIIFSILIEINLKKCHVLIMDVVLKDLNERAFLENYVFLPYFFFKM